MKIRLKHATNLQKGPGNIWQFTCSYRIFYHGKECRGHYFMIYHATSQLNASFHLKRCVETRVFEAQNHVDCL